MAEIEFGTKVTSSPQLSAYLQKKFKKGATNSMLRKIFKKDGGNFFFRTTIEDKNKYFFSLKEDILAKGQAEGMKVSEEVDIEVSKEQLEKLIKIIDILGYRAVNEINKTRETYSGKGVEITIDHYPTNDYLEVEGPTQEIVDSVVRELTPYFQTISATN